jgi:autophagy-related protein 5
MTDNEIRQKVFEGVVPVRFLAPFVDVPLCFNAPRCVSLGTFAYRALDHFLGEESRDLWFSHNGNPLKWHLPLGVLYDALTPDLSVFQPLTVEIHTGDFPAALLRCDSPATASAYFRHAFKQSLQLTDGNQELITHHSGLHQHLERALVEADFSAFSDRFRLRIQSIPHGRQWPIRIVRRDLSVIQAFIEVGEGGQTLQDALNAKDVHATALAIHGIPIEPTAPLAEIAALFLNPDGFVYVVTLS